MGYLIIGLSALNAVLLILNIFKYNYGFFESIKYVLISISLFFVGSIIKNIGANQQESDTYVNPYTDISLYDQGKYKIPKEDFHLCVLNHNEELIYLTDAKEIIETPKQYVKTNIRIYFRWTRRIGSSQSLYRTKHKQTLLYNGVYIVTNQRIIFVSEQLNMKFPLSIPIYKISEIKRTGANVFEIVFINGKLRILVPKTQVKYALGLSQMAIKNK